MMWKMLNTFFGNNVSFGLEDETIYYVHTTKKYSSHIIKHIIRSACRKPTLADLVELVSINTSDDKSQVYKTDWAIASKTGVDDTQSLRPLSESKAFKIL